FLRRNLHGSPGRFGGPSTVIVGILYFFVNDFPAAARGRAFRCKLKQGNILRLDLAPGTCFSDFSCGVRLRRARQERATGLKRTAVPGPSRRLLRQAPAEVQAGVASVQWPRPHVLPRAAGLAESEAQILRLYRNPSRVPLTYTRARSSSILNFSL